jgi:hypothetical protein
LIPEEKTFLVRLMIWATNFETCIPVCAADSQQPPIFATKRTCRVIFYCAGSIYDGARADNSTQANIAVQKEVIALHAGSTRDLTR